MIPHTRQDSCEAVQVVDASLICEGRLVLKSVTLSVSQGQCCAVVGPNGSGKSTLVATIAGYIWPTTGYVSVLGQRYGCVETAKVRQRIGVVAASRVPQFADWMPARSVVATGLFGTIVIPGHRPIERADWQRVDGELASVQLTDASARPFGKLSTGEQMRVMIARAMVADPDLLIFDEPTAGLDMGARVAVVKALEKLLRRDDGPTMLVVSHHIEELPYPLAKVVLLKNGAIVAQGQPSSVLTSKHLSATFDCQVDVVCDSGRYLTRVSHQEWQI